jgi:hypothetical protein
MTIIVKDGHSKMPISVQLYISVYALSSVEKAVKISPAHNKCNIEKQISII